ncbi:MAG: BBP7 family outer membrane beta-barrel protein, partial [Planctomycetes bacterium]|nr:BBP7 family outer membrane beta-barrel protein [Planctomycetota bacterium]
MAAKAAAIHVQIRRMTMPKGMLLIAGLLVGFAAPVMAQSPTTTEEPPVQPEAAKPKVNLEGPANKIITREVASTDALRFWARGEYLLSWVKRAPMPTPIVTLGDPNVGFNGGINVVNSAGATDQPGTQVLFGNSNIGYGAISGMRFTLGGWKDNEGLVGLEATGFLLERRVKQFAATSTGDPALYFPIDSAFAGAPRGIPIADPLRQFIGDVFATSTFEFWGLELNGCLTLWRRPGLEVVMLAGFRYVDLKENFQVNNST